MITLFCIPCAGGSASLYFPWGAALGPNVDLRVLELPGRGRRIGEPLLQDYAQLAALLARELSCAVAGIDTPYAIFGHSMGGLLAQGVARRLAACQVRAPSALLVSACAAPAARQWSPPDDSDPALVASLRRQGGTADEVFDCPELMALVLPVLRADYRVCTSFQPEPGPLRLPVHVFGGVDDAVPAAALQAWQHESTAAVTVDWFAGGHFYLQSQQQALMDRIAHYLARYHRHRLEESPVAEALGNA
ncbi:thioesterase II family protein [Herbaspirillum sp. YR522]|uniref:thioesterase II family protein n=1 Tax=Herbaspirillum sp. YR522 TaxID=1144342 RepID=UPI00026F53CB|nr:alpha/beta fold hydrolase [Herbaspirillum sp. YR522]EJN01798.1 putative thioesterase involved in non-ribosomal peptide biosynthesis [Herbaspirillum sp. YR522]